MKRRQTGGLLAGTKQARYQKRRPTSRLRACFHRSSCEEFGAVAQKIATNGGPDRPARNVGARKRARAFPKGRQLDVEALRQVRELLGSRPRRPDLLIEFLHLIQDRYHYLSAAHLRALCDEMRLPQAEFTRSLHSILISTW